MWAYAVLIWIMARPMRIYLQWLKLWSVIGVMVLENKIVSTLPLVN